MADMTTIKGRIAETIYPNGKGAITAEKHQALLLEMVDEFNNKKADKTDITTPDWNITNPSENGYIMNRTHGIDARLKTAKGTLTELLGGVFSQYVPVIHYDNGELLIRHLYLNGVVVEPEVGKEYQVLYSGSSVFAKIEEDGFGGYDILLKGGSGTGEIVEISVVTIKKLDSPYIPNEIARMEQVDEVREETLAIWEHLEDGYAPNFAVGVADQLAGQDEPTASEINFRRSGGGAILDGNARIEAIKGNSVVWNQLFEPRTDDRSYNEYGAYITDNKDGSYTISTVEGGVTQQVNRTLANIHNLSYAGHKLLITGCDGAVDGFGLWDSYSNTIGTNFRNNVIVSATKNGNVAFSVVIAAGKVVPQTTWKPRVYDLTQMFGAGNEPTTFEEYNARKPIVEDEYAYNEGEVIHCNTESIKSVGDNAWDEEWELGEILQNGTPISSQTAIRSKNFNPIIEGQTYNFHAIDARILIYDKNYTFIDFWSSGTSGNRAFLTSQGSSYFKISSSSNYGGVYKGDICINLSDASINGKYFPYVKRMQSLDIIGKYFPDGMKSAGSAHDEIRYNKASGKWEAVQRIGIFDKWEGRTISNVDKPNLYAFPTGMLASAATPKASEVTCIHEKYEGKSQDALNATESNGIAVFASKRLWIKDMDVTSDPEALITKLSGTKLYYELAEPIVTELDAEDQLRNFDYQVWNCGTEQAIANVPSTPLKADIVYGFNAYGTIKQLKEQVATLMAQMAQMQTAMASVTNNEE